MAAPGPHLGPTLEDDDGDSHDLQVLLIVQIVVDRNEDVESCGREPKEFAVLLATPAGLWNSLDIVPPRTVFNRRGRHSSRRTRIATESIPCEFERSDGLVARHRWVVGEEVVEPIASFKVVDERLDGDTRPPEYRGATQHLIGDLDR